MSRAEPPGEGAELRGQTGEANSLREVVRETVKLWRRHHLTYDQAKHVVEDVRRALQLAAPKERRRTVDRLDCEEIERLIEAVYRRASGYGLMVKTLFYTGTRVSEFVNLRVTDLHLALDPPQVHIVHAKGGSDGCVPILPALAQELRTHRAGRRTGYLFESNRHDWYTARAIQLIVKDTARRAGIEKTVTPHRLRASVASIDDGGLKMTSRGGTDLTTPR